MITRIIPNVTLLLYIILFIYGFELHIEYVTLISFVIPQYV